MIKVRTKRGILEVNEEKIKLEKLLLRLGFNPEDVLVLKDGRLITEDEFITDGEEVFVYEVISRG